MAVPVVDLLELIEVEEYYRQLSAAQCHVVFLLIEAVRGQALSLRTQERLLKVGVSALIVLMGYVVVNVLFGNILEPNLLGRRLGLSTLVVILSLLFWGWAWGPLGALLSVPLTVMVKIWLENTHDLRWVAILLDKAPPPAVVDGAGMTLEV